MTTESKNRSQASIPEQPTNAATAAALQAEADLQEPAPGVPAVTSPEPGEGTAPAGETASEKFVRLALKRVPNAAKQIQLVGNLAGPGYEWTSEQAEKIIEKLQGEIDAVTAALRKQEKAKDEFTL